MIASDDSPSDRFLRSLTRNVEQWFPFWYDTFYHGAGQYDPPLIYRGSRDRGFTDAGGEHGYGWGCHEYMYVGPDLFDVQNIEELNAVLNSPLVRLKMLRASMLAAEAQNAAKMIGW